MKTVVFFKVLLLTAATVGTAWAGPEKEKAKIVLTLDLLDGSRVIGMSGIRTVPVQTPYARINIPLQQIRSIRMDENHQTASIELQNGDRIKGSMNLDPIELETAFGKVSIATDLIRTADVAWADGPLPKGEGSLPFGGVNWVPWRMQFEVQGDKLVSLPKVRPGFNYGHGGNGRGATLVTNIDNPEWKDYSVEFEFGMTGVDPMFNPHQLPLDFRSASILFHVADAKESWNERGGSWYALTFGGDGSWSVSCDYNGFCQTRSGFGNPTSEGRRTLAEGKGLKHDPQAGNKIRIDVCGTRMRIWVDGEQLLDIRDERMGEAIGGKVLDHGGIAFTWGFECMGWIRHFSAKRL